MSSIAETPLCDVFKQIAPTHVLGTTFTISLAFFETFVWPHIPKEQLRRCLLLCDPNGFRAARDEAGAVRGVGREYMAACPPFHHAFHPKAWALLAPEETILLVGSGNLTQSGFMDNAELFDMVRLRPGGPNRGVAEDLVRFIDGMRKLWGEDGSRAGPILETLDDMRRTVEALARRMPEDSDPTLRFLSSFGGPLADQLVPYFSGGTVYAAAPFFGGSAAAMNDLRNRVNATNCTSSLPSTPTAQ